MAKQTTIAQAASILFAQPAAAADTDWPCRVTVRADGMRRVRGYTVTDAARKAMQPAVDADPAFASRSPVVREGEAARRAALRGAAEHGIFATMASEAGFAEHKAQALPPVGLLLRGGASRNFVHVSADTVPVYSGTRELHKTGIAAGAVVDAKSAALLGDKFAADYAPMLAPAAKPGKAAAKPGKAAAKPGKVAVQPEAAPAE